MAHRFASPAYRWLLTAPLTLVLVLIVFAPSAEITRAGVGCKVTIPITGADSDPHAFIGWSNLSGNSLGWLSGSELWHYNIGTSVTTHVTTLTGEISYDIDDNHVVWIDSASQVQLYTISTGVTTALTDGTRLNTSVEIEGNLIVWRQGKKPEKLNKLIVYNTATGTTQQIGKSMQFSLNQGRVLYDGNLYTAATGTTIFLGQSYFTRLDGSYAMGSYYNTTDPSQPNSTPQIAIEDVTTGVITQITDNHFRTFLDSYTIKGDLVVWSAHYGLGFEKSFFAYHISTGVEQPIFYEADYVWPGLDTDGRFVGFNIYDFTTDRDGFFVYDTWSKSFTVLQKDPYLNSYPGNMEDGQIVWVGFQQDDPDKPDMQLFLWRDCGSTPTITDQTPDLNILSGRSATLSVTTVGEQPVSYQWYQGEQGDTTTPVGDNLPTFTTLPLTETTTYWVRTSNAYGVDDSAAITVTPGTSAELVINGSFEQGLNYGAPLHMWKVKRPYPAREIRQRCNQPEKPVAHTGNCAAHYKIFPTRKSKLIQLLADVPYQTGDTLTFSAWIKAEYMVPDQASLLLKVHYTDQTDMKIVLKPAGTQTMFDYTQLGADPITLTGTVEWAQVQIKYPDAWGDWYLDDVSVLHQPGDALMPLPAPSSQLGGRSADSQD